MALQLASEVDVTVVTRSSNREAIERASAPAALRFVYHDLPTHLRFWKRGPLTTEAYYQLWQKSLLQPLRDLVDTRHFDVTMHVTFGRYWVPTPLAMLPLPFVFGPVAGADTVPESFRGTLGWRGRAYATLRDVTRLQAERRGDVRRTLANAHTVLASTPVSARRLESLGARRVVVEPAVGLPDSEVDLLGSLGMPMQEGPATFVSVGRLLAWKGFALGLTAFARIAARVPDARYVIIGDGRDRRRLTRLAAHLGLGDRVEFAGQRSRREVLRTIAKARALIHPSFHDSGGWVCLEAMALARPVVCLDLAGPGYLVPGRAGRLIEASEPTRTIAALSGAMSELAARPDVADQLGSEGRSHVERHYRWSRRGEAFRRIIREVCAEGREGG